VKDVEATEKPPAFKIENPALQNNTFSVYPFFLGLFAHMDPDQPTIIDADLDLQH
jgi:hypothetical protein